MKKNHLLIMILSYTVLFMFGSCSKEVEIQMTPRQNIYLINKYNYNIPEDFLTSVKIIGYSFDRYEYHENILFTKENTDTFKLSAPLVTSELINGIEIAFNDYSLYAKKPNIQFPYFEIPDTIFINISVGYPTHGIIFMHHISSSDVTVSYKIKDSGYSDITETGINLASQVNYLWEYNYYKATYNMVDSTYSVNLNNLTPSTHYIFDINLTNEDNYFTLDGAYFDTLD